ncbi:MAG TPA: PaaI family thioesterase [Actinomycetota bacterium]|nr:PaaI family thioesterase [Actinomycetota bacterium]
MQATEPRIEPAVWQEPVRGGYPDPRLFGLPGLEQMRAYFRGLAQAPPLSRLTGMLPTHVGPGAATFVVPATEWLLTPAPFISLGVQAMLADAALGCAIQTTLAPATPYTTSDLSLSFLRPLEADGGQVAARGRLVHAGRSLGVAELMIEDSRARPVTHGTTRCFFLDPLDVPRPHLEDLPRVSSEPFEDDDPFRRPVAGSPLPQDVWDRMSGLEVMRGFIAGDLPPPPISHLTGLRPIEAGEGTAAFVLPSSGWLTSPIGTVQGGATAMLAETVLATAVQTTCPPRTAYAPLDVKVNYLRPVFADGRDLIGRARMVHRGKTLAVAHAQLENADGKTVAVATGTTLIREGSPWHAEEPAAAPTP